MTDDEVEDLHARLWNDWDFMIAMARRELHREDLREHDPEALAEHICRTVVHEAMKDKTRVGNWRGYYTTIARNEIKNLIRREKKKRSNETPVPFPEEVVQGRAAAEQVPQSPISSRTELWELLPQPLRDLMFARYELDLSLGDAAAIAEVTPTKARRLIDNLRTKVQRVAEGRRIRGNGKEDLTKFAHAVLALRDERSGRAQR